jgi:ribosomal-protein-serine acetyltransferase
MMQFDHYILRFLDGNDLENYYALIDANRKRLEDFFAGTVAQTKSLKETRIHLEEILLKTKKGNYFPFIVVDSHTEKIVASLQVKNVDWNIPKAEIGYYTDNNYAGKGIASRATGMIIDYCFKEKNFHKLIIRTHMANLPSIKVAENNGFKLEGTIRSDYKTTNGKVVDLLYYGLLKEEYKK